MQQEEKTVPAEKSSSVSLTGSLARLKAKTAVQASPAAETEEKSEDIATEAKVTRKRSGAKAKAEVAPEAVPETEVKEEKPRRKRSTAKGAETENSTAAAGDSAAEKAKAALGNVKENVSAAIENFNLKEKLSGLKEKAGDLQQQIKEKPKKFMIIAGIALAVVVLFLFLTGNAEEKAIRNDLPKAVPFISEVISVDITESKSEKQKKREKEDIPEGLEEIAKIFGKKEQVTKRLVESVEVKYTAKVKLKDTFYLIDGRYATPLSDDVKNLATDAAMRSYIDSFRGILKPVCTPDDEVILVGKGVVYHFEDSEGKEHSEVWFRELILNGKSIIGSDWSRRRKYNSGDYDTEDEVIANRYFPEGSPRYEKFIESLKNYNKRKAELESAIREKNSQISAAETKVRDAENSKKVKFERMHREAVAEVNRILNEEFGENKFERNEAEIKTLQRKYETLKFESAGASRAVSSRRAAIEKLQAEIDEFGNNLIYENRIKKRKEQIRELEAGIGKLVEASEKASAALRECKTRLATLEEENRRIHNRKYQLDNEKVKTVCVPAEYNTAISDAKKELEKLKSELSSAQRELKALDFRI